MANFHLLRHTAYVGQWETATILARFSMVMVIWLYGFYGYKRSRRFLRYVTLAHYVLRHKVLVVNQAFVFGATHCTTSRESVFLQKTLDPVERLPKHFHFFILLAVPVSVLSLAGCMNYHGVNRWSTSATTIHRKRHKRA